MSEPRSAAPDRGRHLLKVINMKNSKVLALTSEHFQRLMEHAYAGFELDCKQACRGLKVSMAVNVFGLGILGLLLGQVSLLCIRLRYGIGAKWQQRAADTAGEAADLAAQLLVAQQAANATADQAAHGRTEQTPEETLR